MRVHLCVYMCVWCVFARRVVNGFVWDASRQAYNYSWPIPSTQEICVYCG